MAEGLLTSESIEWIAQQAKTLVSSASKWMTDLQALPVEAAEVEYLRSTSAGDELLQQLQEHIQNPPPHSVGSPFVYEGWLEPQPMATLLEDALRLQGTSFPEIPIEFQPNQLSVLTHSAHSPDFHLITGTEKFQTGFSAADFFAGQIDKYFAYIWQLDIEQADTFGDFIAMSRRERSFAQQVLCPCTCVHELQRIIDYEAAWLLHSCCGQPAPRQFDFPFPMQLTTNLRQMEIPCKAYLPGKLAKRLGCDTGTLATYAVKHAKLPKRDIGQKDEPYSAREVRKICEAFLGKSRLENHKQAATEILNGG